MSLYDPRLHVYSLVITLTDICTAAKTVPFCSPITGKLVKIGYVIDAAPLTDTPLISCEIEGESIEGLSYDIGLTATPLQNVYKYAKSGNEVKEGDVISLKTDGAGTGTVNVSMTLFFEGDA